MVMEKVRILFLLGMLLGMLVMLSSDSLRSSIGLIGSFIVVGTGMYMIGMKYIGMVMIVVYAGTICMLCVFIVMLVTVGSVGSRRNGKVSVMICLVMLMLVLGIGLGEDVIIMNDSDSVSVGLGIDSVGSMLVIGSVLIGSNGYCVVMLGMVLLVGIVGSLGIVMEC